MIGMINNLSWYPKVNQSIGCLKMQYRYGLWLHLVVRKKFAFLQFYSPIYWIHPGPAYELQPAHLKCHNFLLMEIWHANIKSNFLYIDYLINLLQPTNVIKSWPKILETLLNIKKIKFIHPQKFILILRSEHLLTSSSPSNEMLL